MSTEKIQKPTNHLHHHSTFEFVYTANARISPRMDRLWQATGFLACLPLSAYYKNTCSNPLIIISCPTAEETASWMS